MGSVKLLPQQNITVQLPSDDQLFHSRIEDISGSEVTIAPPLSDSAVFPARAGDEITVRVPMKTHCLEFTTRLVEIKTESGNLYKIRYPETIDRVQLRQDVRIDMLMDVMFSPFPAPGSEPVYRKAVAVNMSAGGMRISIPEEIPEGTPLLVKFYLPVKGYVHNFEIEAVVVRSQPSGSKEQMPVHQLGLNFHKINSKQKDIIYRFIFEKMSQRKRTGRM